MEQQQDQKKNIFYIIEHFEEEISKWTYCEYTHMIMVLSNLYNESSAASKLIITNFPFMHLLKAGELKEDEYGTKKYTEGFLKINENLMKKCLMSKYSLLELTSSASIDKIQSNPVCDDTNEILSLLSTYIKPSQENVCFMDMRGTSDLEPTDQFNFLIFGGILGDHPPQDRGKDLRSNFENVRSLGKLQMTTDTALLVSREIIEEGKKFSELPFVDEPQIPTDDAIKRYLDLTLPLDALVEDKLKLKETNGDLKLFRAEAAKKDIKDFEAFCVTQKLEENDAEKEEFTIMEGFRYRVNDTVFPVFKGNKKLEDFPIIPIGMLDIWRSENDDFDF